MMIKKWHSIIPAILFLSGCGEGTFNSPHPKESGDDITYYSSFTLPPKHLDPALSYATDESVIIDQIYESPLGYHFLKRPYELRALAAESLPTITYLNAAGEEVTDDSEDLAYTRYTLTLKKDLRYQPHPAFALDANDQPLYLFDNEKESAAYGTVADFPETASRQALANDFVYQVKRLADPKNKSPLLGFMAQYIVGLKEFSAEVGEVERNGWLNLNDFDMSGLEVVDDRTFSITIYKRYPQFVYWLAMHFFAPIAPEVDRFYKNPGFNDKNLTLDWHPVGTGAFMMSKNDPNSEIVLERNPNFRLELYPSEGAEGDLEAGFLADAGVPLPLIDRAVFRLEKEVLPRWTKFLQGYYDRSGETHSNTRGVFDQAFVVGPDGMELSPEMQAHELTLSEDVKPSMYYYGFNMRDPVVGGYTEERRKLRRALSIAFDVEDYINIFSKGNAIAAQSPVPPGIPGNLTGELGINPYIYDWVDEKPVRKSLELAKQLLAESGYPNGRDRVTGEPLKLFIDVQSQAISNAQMDWIRRQMSSLGVQVEYRPADWNRTREKLMTGNTQIYSHGWLADYPDPENFLFLLFSPESPLVCNCDGANNSNYENPEFDAKFRAMRTMNEGPERDLVIAGLIEMWRRDNVWLFSYHPLEFYLNNRWVYNHKRHGISKRTLQYLRVEPDDRAQSQLAWNQPVVWPVIGGFVGFVALLFPAVRAYRRRQKMTITPATPTLSE
ncbi:MAG: oligopeptide transport system substrate-binding protein [Halieaceae bacterium]|jgi:oligopeptide transport system substrate-binding protein